VSKLRVLIVDDEDDMRALARATIEMANHGLAVAAEAIDAEEAMDRWRDKRPEVVVLDQRMPGVTGLDIARQILAEDPAQVIVLYTAYLDERLRQAAKRVGIRACLHKDDHRQLPNLLWAVNPAC
jgi:DNA-binding NarL/FixJ family response regulator